MTFKKFFNFKKNRDWAENLQVVTQLGLTMAGCILFCLFVGRFLDQWLGTKGIFTVLFIILGIIGGGVVVYRQIMEIMEPGIRDRSKENDEEPPRDSKE